MPAAVLVFSTVDTRLLPRPDGSGVVAHRLAGLRPGERLAVIDDHESALLVRATTLGLPGFDLQVIESGPTVWRTVYARRQPLA